MWVRERKNEASMVAIISLERTLLKALGSKAGGDSNHGIREL